MTTLVFAALLATLAQQVSPTPFAQAQDGMWASAAKYLWPGPTALAGSPAGGRSIDVVSPDGRRVITVRDSELAVKRTQGARDQIGASVPIEGLAEVLWAPDSRAFAITQSDGGWVGSWSTVIYEVADTALHRVDIAQQALADFNHRSVRRDAFGCSGEEGNVGVAAWRNDSRRVLLVAEAPSHSSDCDPGRLHGYLVDAHSGAVHARYSERDVRTLFRAALGARFR
jgi:hypothetical protein